MSASAHPADSAAGAVGAGPAGRRSSARSAAVPQVRGSDFRGPPREGAEVGICELSRSEKDTLPRAPCQGQDRRSCPQRGPGAAALGAGRPGTARARGESNPGAGQEAARLWFWFCSGLRAADCAGGSPAGVTPSGGRLSHLPSRLWRRLFIPLSVFPCAVRIPRWRVPRHEPASWEPRLFPLPSGAVQGAPRVCWACRLAGLVPRADPRVTGATCPSPVRKQCLILTRVFGCYFCRSMCDSSGSCPSCPEGCLPSAPGVGPTSALCKGLPSRLTLLPSGGEGSTATVCSFQPPPRVLSRRTWNTPKSKGVYSRRPDSTVGVCCPVLPRIDPSFRRSARPSARLILLMPAKGLVQGSMAID